MSQGIASFNPSPMRSSPRPPESVVEPEGELVVLVDRRDRRVGVAPKMAAHVHGWRHRALSVFVVNDRHELLLQKRSPAKYHSGNLWSNTCCGHPRPGERVAQAATRRLQQEMGFDCQLHRVGAIQYALDVGNGLVEREYLHLFVGRWNGQPEPAMDEVSRWRWCALIRYRRVDRYAVFAIYGVVPAGVGARGSVHVLRRWRAQLIPRHPAPSAYPAALSLGRSMARNARDSHIVGKVRQSLATRARAPCRSPIGGA